MTARQSEAIGHASYLIAKREAGLACVRSPRDRARILGVPYSLPEAKEHRIDIDLKRGTRRVEVIDSSPAVAAPRAFTPLPAPATAIKTLPPRPEVVVRVQPLSQQRDVSLSIALILTVVASCFGVTVGDLTSHKRARRFSEPRHAAFKIIRDRMNYSTSMIGRMVGKRDHTTIMSGVRRCEIHQVNPDWRERYDRALALLGNPLPAGSVSPDKASRAAAPIVPTLGAAAALSSQEAQND